MSPLRCALFAVLLVGAAACGDAAAAQRVAAVPAAPAGSVALVQRLTAGRAQALPDVTGLSATAAQSRLAGMNVSVVGFGERGSTVSAQWPPAGAARPADGEVVVWVGQPPAPPKARKPAPLVTLTDGPGPELPTAAPIAPPTTVVAAASVPRTGGPGSGVTPGLERIVEPPHAPRANIRTLPPAEPGTTLAGRASWYGPGFEGRGTACGTTFDPSELTLASRELRCGSTVTVTGPAGSVQATVTDWGPAEWTARRFDLSQATFAAVSSLGSGVIDVTVKVQ